VTRRGCLLAVALAALTATPTARADLFGGDLPLLTGILTQSIAEVSDLGAEIGDIATQIELMRTMLSQLDPSSFSVLSNFLTDATYSLSNLQSGVSAIGYTLGAVDGQFQRQFPSNLAGVAFAQFDGLYNQWASEVLGAAQIAVRAQTEIASIKDQAREATAILANASRAQGEVAQLQAVVQMLGLMQAQNGALVQTLATTGRVLASSAAVAASERQLSREKKRRQLAGYTSRGRPVPPMPLP
jgi:conjugal transfer/entry exclusion protein